MQIRTEELNLIYIKYIIENIIGVFLHILRIFIPQKNTIVFSSFSGRQYSDSPKYISEYLSKYHPDLKQIWAFNNPMKFKEILNKDISIVRFKSLKFILAVLSCRIYVDNVEFWSILNFSKKQIVIETWHGGGAYKRVGQDRLDIKKAEKQHIIKKMNKINIFLSSSKAFTQFVLKGAYNYSGEILECGLPRNDTLLNENLTKINEIKKTLNIPSSSNIVLYAPTFRNNLNENIYDLNFSYLTKTLTKKFGGEWIILFRFHYYMQDISKIKNNTNIIDVTNYPDIQDLLKISNILVTDYSSSIWDMCLLKKPCFLYTPDIDDYYNERNFYTPIESWGVPYAKTNMDLGRKILEFDYNKYLNDINSYQNKLGNCESGNATKIISERIVSYMQEIKNVY